MRKEYQKPLVYVYEESSESLMYSLSLEPQDDIVVGAKGIGLWDETGQDGTAPMRHSPWDE
ncbi:MAG: hypothetical protein IJK42_02630 [Prevotella sp.]|nr:hypothetical protein [Prevotella sp.]